MGGDAVKRLITRLPEALKDDESRDILNCRPSRVRKKI